MNKLFTKIAGAVLGLTLTIGVGLGVSRQAEPSPVHAATSDVVDVLEVKTFNDAPSSYTTDGTEYSKNGTSGVTYLATGINKSGNIRGNQAANTGNFNLRNSITKEGYYLSKLVIETNGSGTMNSTTTNRSVLIVGSSVFDKITNATVPAGTQIKAEENSSATNVLTFKNSDTSVSYFQFYSLKTSDTCEAAVITATWSIISSGPARTVTNVTLTGDMTNKTYAQGSAWDFTGLILTITYDSGDPDVINFSDVDEDIYEVNPASPNSMDIKSLTITGQYADEFDFGITIDEITVTEAPKEATYTIGGSNTVPSINVSGLVPQGSSATWENSYTGSNLGQMTGGNSTTFTISGFSKTTIITSLTLNMKSNSSSGAGNLVYSVDDGSEVTLVATKTFNQWPGRTSYSSSFVPVAIDLGQNGIEVTSKIVFKINATTNSLYCTDYTISYDYASASVSASKTQIELTANGTDSETITLSSTNLEGAVTYNAVSGNTTVLPQTNLVISGSSLTIKAGTTAHEGVNVSVTATNGTITTEAVNIIVKLTVSRNVTSIDVVTQPKTSYKEGELFEITGIVVSATFDNGESPVQYSAENQNLDDLKFSIAGNEVTSTTSLTEVGTHQVTVSLTVGNATKTDTFEIVVNARTFYKQVSSEAQLFDGQQLVIADADLTRIAGHYNGTGNNLVATTVTIDTDNTRVDEANISGLVFTLGRVDVDGQTVYTLFDGTYYLYAAGTKSTGTNYLKGLTTLDESCYWYISVEDDSGVTISSVNNSVVPHLQFNQNNNLFSCYASTNQKPVTLLLADTDTTGTSAAKAFADNYMHMDDYNDLSEVTGLCAGANGYFAKAKVVWNAMLDDDKAAFVENHGEAWARLQAWANANGDVLDSDLKLVSKSRTSLTALTENNNIAILIIVIASSMTLVAGVIVFKRKKNQLSK